MAVFDIGTNPQPRLSGMIGHGDYVDAAGNPFGEPDGPEAVAAETIGCATFSVDGQIGVTPKEQILAIMQTKRQPAAMVRENQLLIPPPPWPPRIKPKYGAAIVVASLAAVLGESGVVVAETGDGRPGRRR